MKMEMEKDYTLLRDFDLEKAKAGEAICGNAGAPVIYAAGPDSRGYVVYIHDGIFYMMHKDNIRMAQLAWVEGKPVYKGDVLYHPTISEGEEVYGAKPDGDLTVASGYVFSFGNDRLTWTPPKKTREVKLLGWLTGDGSLEMREAGSMKFSGWVRVPSEDRTVTVEE